MSDETQQYYSTVFGDKGSPSGQLLQDGATDTVANHYKHLFQAKKATPEATGSGWGASAHCVGEDMKQRCLL